MGFSHHVDASNPTKPNTGSKDLFLPMVSAEIPWLFMAWTLSQNLFKDRAPPTSRKSLCSSKIDRCDIRCCPGSGLSSEPCQDTGNLGATHKGTTAERPKKNNEQAIDKHM